MYSISKIDIMLLSTTILLTIAYNGVESICPNEALITPCVCTGDEQFTCGESDMTYSIKEKFTKLAALPTSKKEYQSITITKTSLKTIPDHIFDNIRFREIKIINAVQLTTIHLDAFTGTDLLTTEFTIFNSPKLIHNPPYHLYNIFAKFRKMKKLVISKVGLTEIPPHAFRNLQNLVWLEICGPRLVKLGSKAFYNLGNLVELHISNTSLNYIPKEALYFNKTSEKPIDICLYKNSLLKGDCFDPMAFAGIHRPVQIDFSGERSISGLTPHQIKFLGQNIFHPFFKANLFNKIDMTGQHFDCQDCRNHWLKKFPEVLPRIVGLKCANGRYLLDPINFPKCK